MRLNLGCGPSVIPGFVNLDARFYQEVPRGTDFRMWRFEQELPFGNDSVEGITISHALSWGDSMRCRREWWPAIFKECFRVLKLGGVLRITEPVISPTEELDFGVDYDKAALLQKCLKGVGFDVFVVDVNTTKFKDKTLMQNLHENGNPKLWFEAVKV